MNQVIRDNGSPNVVHFLPYDAVGGVEVAARSIVDSKYKELIFSKLYLVDKKASESENHPRAYFRSFFRLQKTRPDLLIASLWRCCAVMLIYKFLSPRAKCVTFLHSAHAVHFLDDLFNRLAMWMSVEIWADSKTTLDARVPNRLKGKSRVISFLIEHSPEPVIRVPAPNFVFWGRLHQQKGLDHAVRFFGEVAKHRPDARFFIIGPDGGEQASLQEKIIDAGIVGIRFLGSMERSDIFQFASECNFYLQTSREEGMAMSVVEAMQAGLVPVVTPVGEIGSYSVDGDNAILVDDDDAAVEAVLRLLDDPPRYQQMAKNASRTWQDRPLYRDDVLSACRHLLGP